MYQTSVLYANRDLLPSSVVPGGSPGTRCMGRDPDETTAMRDGTTLAWKFTPRGANLPLPIGPNTAEEGDGFFPPTRASLKATVMWLLRDCFLAEKPLPM